MYSYDSAARLIESSVNGISETYTYDSFGNLKAKTAAGVTESRMVDSLSNRFAAESYDAAGNQLTDTSRPADVSTSFEVGYQYDSLSINLPAWKTIGIDIAHIVERHTVGGARTSDVATKLST